MSYVPSAASDIIKKPQYVEETTPGTLPLTSPSFKSCGFVESLGENIAVSSNAIRNLGSYDVSKMVRMGEELSTSISFQPFDFKLMKYGIVSPSTTPAPDPTMATPNGTPYASLSIYMTALINGTEKAKIYKGVRFAGCSGTIERDSGFKVTMPIICKEITDWVVIPTFTTPTYATDPVGTPWSGISSGADPLDINTTKYDTTSFKFDVSWTVAQPSFNGMTTPKLSKHIKREIKGSFDTTVLGGALVGDLRGYTPRDIEYTLMPAGATKIKFNSCQFTSYSKDVSGDSDDIWMESFEWQATNGITFTGT